MRISLRSRLLAAVGVIALVALVVADVVTYSALRSFLYARVDAQLDAFHGFYEQRLGEGRLLIRCAGRGPFDGGGPSPGTTAPAGGEVGPPPNAIQISAVQVRTTTGVVVAGQSCPAYVDGTAYLPALPATITGFAPAPGRAGVVYFDAPASRTGGPTFRVLASTLPDGNVLVLAQPLGDVGSTLHRLLLIELAVTGGAVVIALAGGLWLVHLGLHPLRDMERVAESIAAGNLRERVPGEDEGTEVGRLARTLNLMLGRIESAFAARVASEGRLRASEARMRRFVADASHELRTPIAAVSAYAELFDRGASEQKEDLERLLGGIRTETGRMEHLVADLLLLARLDEGRPLDVHPVDLVALCAEAVQTASTVGPAWPVTFSAAEPLEVRADASRLRQVVDNLLANVRAHTPPGTATRVTVTREGAGAAVTVTDDGPGMDPDQAAHAFERFYRADPSRSRLHGGTGLGLSIVQAIVGAHGGRVEATSTPGEGTSFAVHLPAEPPAPAVPRVGDDDESGVGARPGTGNGTADGAGSPGEAGGPAPTEAGDPPGRPEHPVD